MQKRERELHKPHILKAIKRALSPGEWKWKFCSGAREGPRKIFSSDEQARKYVNRVDVDYFVEMAGFSRGEYTLYRGMEKIKQDAYWNKRYGEASEANKKLLGTIRLWMDDEYLGARAYNALLDSPPILLTVHKTPLRKLGESACYFGTNCITVRFLGEDGGRVEGRISEIAREFHHYASWLGKGDRVRWRDGDGKPVFRRKGEEAAEALGEGVAEMLTLQLIRKHGVEGSRTRSANSVFLMLHIQEIAGEAALRKAYFCGDYTKVREKIDDAMGECAFEGILEELNRGGSWDALLMLRRMCREAGFSVDGFYERPLLKEVLKEMGSKERLPFEK